jgi:uncharacterized membrane protein YtjA (UPF0391 family)
MREGMLKIFPRMLYVSFKIMPGKYGIIFHLLNSGQTNFSLKTHFMLRWTVTFLIIAIIAAVLGFGGIAAGAASIAKILFFIFLVLFIISLIFGKKFTKS